MKIDLTKGKAGKSILLFTLPMLLGNIFQQFHNVVDGIIVGKFIGDIALAAVGAVFPIHFTITALIVGITIGGSTMIAQYFGAKEFDKIKITADTIQIFLIYSAIILGTICIFIAEPLFRLMDIPESIISEATIYFKIVVITSFIPTFSFFGTMAILRGMGDTMTPIFFLVGGVIINIILNIVFVVGLGMGIEGAAYATGIASIAQWLGLAIYTKQKSKTIKLEYFPWKMKFDKKRFLTSVKIGLPTGIQQTFVGIGAIALVSIISKFGVSAIAAYTAAGRIDLFISMPAMNLAVGLSTFVSQNIGAGQRERIGKGLRSSLLYTTILCILLLAIINLFGEEVMSLFTDANSPHRTEIIDLGKRYLVIVSSFYLAVNTMFIFNAVPRGAGATVIPMLVTLLALWAVRIPVAIYLADKIGIEGVFWSIPIAWVVGLCGSAIYYFSGKWKKNKID